MGRLNQALIAANADKIEDAKDAYVKEHGGKQPTLRRGCRRYVADTRLRQAVREGPC